MRERFMDLLLGKSSRRRGTFLCLSGPSYEQRLNRSGCLANKKPGRIGDREFRSSKLAHGRFYGASACNGSATATQPFQDVAALGTGYL
jgi:hypothetical protein